MQDILLRELNSSDIDWILNTGRQREISANAIVAPAGKTIDTFDIVLGGVLNVNYLNRGNNPLAEVFDKLGTKKSQPRGLKIFQLESGEVIGEDCLLGKPEINSVEIVAVEPSRIISLPLLQLETKMEQDAGFAYRWYRAIVILLANRLEEVIAEIGRRQFAPLRTARDVLFIFGQLHDSDIDWAIANGRVRQVAANKILVRQETSVDTLYILLTGTMKVSISEDESNPLSRAFATLEEREFSGRELTKLGKGEILGENFFIDGRLSYATIKAIENSAVLAISRQQLASKLQQDLGFAGRFYRAIATLMSYRLDELIRRLGYGKHTYSQGSESDEDELDSDLLEQISVAATRFNSMLERLGCF